MWHLTSGLAGMHWAHRLFCVNLECSWQQAHHAAWRACVCEVSSVNPQRRKQLPQLLLWNMMSNDFICRCKSKDQLAVRNIVAKDALEGMRMNWHECHYLMLLNYHYVPQISLHAFIGNGLPLTLRAAWCLGAVGEDGGRTGRAGVPLCTSNDKLKLLLSSWYFRSSAPCAHGLTLVTRRNIVKMAASDAMLGKTEMWIIIDQWWEYC